MGCHQQAMENLGQSKTQTPAGGPGLPLRHNVMAEDEKCLNLGFLQKKRPPTAGNLCSCVGGGGPEMSYL